jgi:hypothetical protein
MVPDLFFAVLFGIGIIVVDLLRYRIALTILGCFLTTLLMEDYVLTHYLASALGLFLVILIAGYGFLHALQLAGAGSAGCWGAQ